MEDIFHYTVYTISFVIIIAIVITLSLRSVHSEEINTNIDSALEETVENALYEAQSSYTIRDNDEFIADFTQTLMASIDTANTLVQVDVYGIDYEKGLLSLKVTEFFKNPDGSTTKQEVLKTVIFDSDEKEHFKVALYIGDTLYKTYNVKEDAVIQAPPIPSNFAGLNGTYGNVWLNEDGREVVFPLTVSKDLQLHIAYR